MRYPRLPVCELEPPAAVAAGVRYQITKNQRRNRSGDCRHAEPARKTSDRRRMTHPHRDTDTGRLPAPPACPSDRWGVAAWGGVGASWSLDVRPAADCVVDAGRRIQEEEARRRPPSTQQRHTNRSEPEATETDQAPRGRARPIRAWSQCPPRLPSLPLLLSTPSCGVPPAIAAAVVCQAD